MTRVCLPGALGACVLSAALLIGGPAAIAMADDGPSGGGSGGTSSVGSGGSTGTAPAPGTPLFVNIGMTRPPMTDRMKSTTSSATWMP